MSKTFTLFILGLFVCVELHAQSESHVFTTYDTTIIYHYNPYLSFTYYLRISRPTDLFTKGSPDTASRPAIFFMPGVGEMNSNQANLYKYGPHYWLANGWDGSVVLGNGTHYPILISMICNVNPPDPPITGNFWVMDYLIHHYHIKARGVHLTGLSEGAFTWGGMMGITDTTGTGQSGADIGCREVTSLTLLSGAATSSGNWAVFGHWAQVYGGKAFLTVGYDDGQIINPPQLAQAMNGAVKGSAYFTYNTVDGGQHGGWNTEYDPSQHNWQSFQPFGQYITGGADTNSRGSYKNGSSIFQWMLRQGDTSLAGGVTKPVANAGTGQTVALPSNGVALSGSGTESGGTIASYAWSLVSGPSQYTFNSSTVANPVVSNLTAGTYVFKLTVTDANGATASANVTIVVNAATSTPAKTTYYAIPGTIQAESYSSMSGVATQATTDEGGGLNVGWIDEGDWMDYAVNVQTAGTYTVSFRVAAINSGAAFELDNGGSTVYANMSVPNTAGFQTWKTITASVTLAAGTQTLRLLSTGASEWNINWMSFSTAASSVYAIPGMIQAENYSSSHGVSTQNTADVGGGLNVDEIYQGDWMEYNVNVASAGTYTVALRVASLQSGASFALESSSGTVYAQVQVPNTGGWQTYTTINATVQLPAGLQTLKLVSLNASAWNINWMLFNTSGSGVYVVPGMIQAENFSSSLGVSTQNTADAGGGLNVDEIYLGDWMEYNVNVVAAGTYTVALRVASLQSGASFALESSSGTVYTKVSVPNTGGWQTYTTVSATVQLPAGLQTLKLVSLNASAWNINWMSFTVPVTTASNRTEEISGAAIAAIDDSSAARTGLLLLYPNPTTDVFQLSIDNAQTGKFLVQVISSAGRLVKTYTFEKGLSEMQVQISLAGLPAGIYLIRIGGTDWQVIRKEMKL
jgi:Carbohydrate binding module (family 6)/Secretion system C-terminal sorting domain